MTEFANEERMRVDSYSSDKIKVIGLFLTLVVVYHHGYNLQFASGDVNRVLWWPEAIVHFGLRGLSVPFFFVVSAYFLFSRPCFESAFPQEVHKRLRSLLLPFVVWSCAWLTIMALLQSVPILAGHFGREIINPHDWRQLLRLVTLDPIPHPLWYMRDLFVLTLLSPLVLRIMRSNVAAMVYFIATGWLWCAFTSLDVREAQDLFFFGLGAWIAIRRPAAPSLSRGSAIALTIASLGIFVIHCQWVAVHHREMPLLFNAGILLGLPAMWYLVDHCRQTLVTPRIVRASGFALFVYVAHEPLQAMLRKPILAAFGGSSWTLAVVWIVVSTGIILGLALIANQLAARAPAVYGLLVGGRGVPHRAKTNVSVVAAPSSVA